MPRLRDGAERIGYRAALATPRMRSGMPRQIALADKSDEAVLIVNDRQPPNLTARHLPHAAFNRVLRIAGEDPIRHAFINPRPPRVQAAPGNPDGDVAVSHHPNQPVIAVHHGECAAVAFAHQSRGALDRIVGMN